MAETMTPEAPAPVEVKPDAPAPVNYKLVLPEGMPETRLRSSESPLRPEEFPNREDFARAEGEPKGLTRLMLKLSSSRKYGSPRTRKISGAASATALGVNGPASAAIAPEYLSAPGVMEHTVGFTHNTKTGDQIPAPSNPDGVEFEIHDTFLERYQRDFMANQQQDVLDDDPQITDFVTEHEEVLKHPELIDGDIVITGLASDEALGQNLGKPDKKNEYLAGQRGFLAAGALIYQVRERYGVDISNKVRLGAHEGILSDTEIAELTELAGPTKFNYESVKDMIDRYNGITTGKIGDVPPRVAEILDLALGRQRGATVEIRGHKPFGNIPKGVGETAVMAHLAPGYKPEEQPGMPAPNRAFRRQAKDKPRRSQVDPRAPAHHRIQPREHSNSKSPSDVYGGRGKTGRSHGGNSGRGPGSKTTSRAAYKRVQMRRR